MTMGSYHSQILLAFEAMFITVVLQDGTFTSESHRHVCKCCLNGFIVPVLLTRCQSSHENAVDGACNEFLHNTQSVFWLEASSLSRWIILPCQACKWGLYLSPFCGPQCRYRCVSNACFSFVLNSHCTFNTRIKCEFDVGEISSTVLVLSVVVVHLCIVLENSFYYMRQCTFLTDMSCRL